MINGCCSKRRACKYAADAIETLGNRNGATMVEVLSDVLDLITAHKGNKCVRSFTIGAR